MHAMAPARPRLRAVLLFVVAVIASMVAASPAIASQLAHVRTKFASGAPSAQQPASPKKAPSNSRTSVLELPLVVVSPDRSVEVPVMQVPAQQPAKRALVDSAARRAPQLPRKIIADSLPRRVIVDSVPPRRGYVDPKIDSTLKPVAFAPGGSPTPRYPDILRAAAFSGDLIVQVVVDSSGLPIPRTLKVVRSAHDLFEASFRAVLPEIRLTPATLGDRRVRQLIQLVFRFDFEDAPPQVVPPLSPTLATFVIDVTVRRR